MFTVIAEKPNADIAYLYGGIVREALANKFEKLFGRKPVAVEIDEPLKVENTRVPEMILGSVDQEVAKILKASAIEAAKNISGEIPEPPSSTFLYKILDDSAAQTALEAVKEYQELQDVARDATLAALDGIEDVSVKEGIAYLTGKSSEIEIGIFADNKEFALEFQYRLEQLGGATIEEDKKVTVFDELFSKLPGDKQALAENVRNSLLEVVGLTGALPSKTK